MLQQPRHTQASRRRLETWSLCPCGQSCHISFLCRDDSGVSRLAKAPILCSQAHVLATRTPEGLGWAVWVWFGLCVGGDLPDRHVIGKQKSRGDLWPDQSRPSDPSPAWIVSLSFVFPSNCMTVTLALNTYAEKPFFARLLIKFAKGVEHLTSVCQNISWWLLSNLILSA